ncbi:unnamed protein product, partial [Hapterophycus canaliculatus]
KLTHVSTPKLHAQVLKLTLEGQEYTPSSVQEWTGTICSQTLAALRVISGSFKYTATCVLTQKMGGGVHTSSAACYEPSNDGCVVERWENQTILAIVVVFGLSL